MTSQSDSHVRLTLQPGARGTRRWVDKYGDQLVCVRYRYNPQTQQRHTTVEIVVATAPWSPSVPPPAPDTILAVRVEYTEEALRQQVKAAGGRWNPQAKVWELRYDQILKLGLGERIVMVSDKEGI